MNNRSTASILISLAQLGWIKLQLGNLGHSFPLDLVIPDQPSNYSKYLLDVEVLFSRTLNILPFALLLQILTYLLLTHSLLRQSHVHFVANQHYTCLN
jgi:hypothetical protein